MRSIMLRGRRINAFVADVLDEESRPCTQYRNEHGFQVALVIKGTRAELDLAPISLEAEPAIGITDTIGVE